MNIEPQTLTLVHLVAASQQAPAPGTKPPLLVLLHGVGSNEQDLFALASYVDPRFVVVSARAPITLGPRAYAWYHVQWNADGTPTGDTAEGATSRVAILNFVQEAIAAYDTDPSQTYLAGFSQGAIMSLYVALTAPKTVSGIVLMSGRLAPQIWDERAPDAELKGLPILAVHGLRDRVLPIADGREMRNRLSKLPVALTYKEYDMAHEVSGESLGEVARFLTARLDAPAG